MKIKENLKITNVLKIIVFTLILLILSLGVNTKANAAELFVEDVPLSFHGIPRYGDIGPLVFCSKKGYGTEVYIDCSKTFAALLGSGTHEYSYSGFGAIRTSETYTILGEDPITKVNYNWSGYSWHMAEYFGPIWLSSMFRSEVADFISDYNSVTSALGDDLISTVVGGYNYSTTEPYFNNPGGTSGLDYMMGNPTGEFDYERVWDPSIGLPVFNGYDSARPPLYSLQFDQSTSFDASQVQAALYIETAPQADDETKQRALWGLKPPYIYNQGNITGGNWLTTVATMYEDMYKKLNEFMKQGMSYGEAYLESIKANTKNVKRIEKVDIEGGNYDLYVYDNIVWKVNKDEKAYYLGPFSIDYSVVGAANASVPSAQTSTRGIWRDEDVPGRDYGSGWAGWLGVYYDYIKNVTVYNQDKKNIAELGGSFEILDEYGDVIYDGDKEDLQKIAPGQEFYIKVNMGSMEAKDFENFYAKFDFKYICQVTGSATRYKATINKWGYAVSENHMNSFGLTGKYKYKHWKWYPGWKSYTTTDEKGVPHVHRYYTQYARWDWEEDTGAYSDTTQYIPGYTYKLYKGVAGEFMDMGQDQTHLEGKRVWDEQSIVLTTEWEPIDVEVDIEKTCSKTGEHLYGAQFDITLDIVGTDKFGNDINEHLTFTRMTGTDGIARLPREEIEAMGVDLSSFSGTITVTAKETYAPAGHTITQEVYTGSFSSGVYTIHATDDETEGVIRLAKVDQNGNYIDASFKVIVYEEGKDYPSIQDHSIPGRTENGVMYISREDLRTKCRN